ILIILNRPTDITYLEKKETEIIVDFAAILTGKEQVPAVDTLDTALAIFQSTNKKDKKDYDLKYSVNVIDMDKIKEVQIDIGKLRKNEREERKMEKEKKVVVAELYKSDIPSDKVIMGTLCNGIINSQKLKGSLQGKNTNDLVRKIKKGEAYVNILTEDKPKGKVRGKIEKLAPV
ncbi:MAG TPA: CHRD domain-containing protein, partial [Nitrososphaeraceae archaeon]|nr:CHRD domain-containing protein [Nitrososphaeraceae archaeon]